MFVFLRQAFLIYLFAYYFFIDSPQFALIKLYNIKELLNRLNCWNFQIDWRDLDRTVSSRSNLLFFYDVLIIFVRRKADVVHQKKYCLVAFSVGNVIVFN